MAERVNAATSIGPAEEWFCCCWNYLRHRVLNPASKERCETCGRIAPHLRVEDKYVDPSNIYTFSTGARRARRRLAMTGDEKS